MHHLFLPPDQIVGETARIVGSDHLHLARVLRARPGDHIALLDNRGNAFEAVLTAVEKAETTARIVSPLALPPEPAVFLSVAQALCKGDRFEQVVQHGAEVGAGAFIPLRADRCVVELPAARVADRLARWRQVAKGAAEQSGRLRIAEIASPRTFPELLSESAHQDALLVLQTGGDTVGLRTALLRFTTPPARLLLAVGPEGGWSPAEVSAARAANVSLVSLGPRILRTETAALVAISQILYHFQNPNNDG